MFRSLIPISMALILVIIGIFASAGESIKQGDPTILLEDIATKIFAVDYALYENVDNFKTSGNYGI